MDIPKSQALIIGAVVLIGFILKRLVAPDSYDVFGDIVIFFGAYLIISSIFYFDGMRHRKHLEKWSLIEPKGIFHFVLMRYVLMVWIPFSTIIYFMLDVRAAEAATILFVIIPMLVGVVLYGIKEWQLCRQEKSGERLHSLANDITKK